MRVADVATRGFDLLNHLRARGYWARRRVEIAFLNENRDVLESIDLSRSEISETPCLQLDDGFNLTS